MLRIITSKLLSADGLFVAMWAILPLLVIKITGVDISIWWILSPVIIYFTLIAWVSIFSTVSTVRKILSKGNK